MSRRLSQDAQQVLAGLAGTTLCHLIVAAELALKNAVVPLCLLLLAKLHDRTRSSCCGPGRAGRGHRLGSPARTSGVAPVALKEELLALPAAQAADCVCISCHLFLPPSIRRDGASADGSRCAGMGVTSLIIVTSRPAVCRARIAASRPEPGPLTIDLDGLQTVLHGGLGGRLGCGLSREGGGLFLLPRKPMPPAEAQEMALPLVSVMVTMVLLKEELICTAPRFNVLALSAASADLLPCRCCHYISLPYFFLLAMVRFGTLAGTGVGLAALAADGQALPVAQAAVAADLGQALDVQRHAAAQVALHDDSCGRCTHGAWPLPRR